MPPNEISSGYACLDMVAFKPRDVVKKAKDVIGDTRNYEELLLSAISIWELCKLVEKERIVLSYEPEEWIKQAVDMPKFRVVPLTPAIACRSTTLPGSFNNSGPADQIIVATCREENATLLTADKKMHAYKYVRSLW
jgi:PIN domain nuclease of toxin-antitoxin system